MHPARLLCLFLSAALFAQDTSSISGTVRDPQGGVVPGAPVEVLAVDTNARYATTSNARGEWIVPSLPTATYRVKVSLTGFQTAEVEDIRLQPGSPATVHITLTVGSVAESVEVTAGAEVLQTESTSVTTNLEHTQVRDLPVSTRNGNELITLLAGTASPGTIRTSSINGLPMSSLNMTLDGATMHDTYLRSSDGFFSSLQAKPEAVEEVAITTATGSADLLGQGAAQIRFVTKSGTNQIKGSVFWQNRNDFFNANYFFNTIDGLPRDRINLNQFGGSVGGPIRKDKLFFFVNQEWFRLPQTTNSGRVLVPTDAATDGKFTYIDSNKTLRTVDLYGIAAAGNASLPSTVRPFATTPDSAMLGTLKDMVRMADPARGSLQSRVDSFGDYNRNYYNFQIPGQNKRSFPTAHIDWIASSKHRVDVVGNYQTYYANPDTVNGTIPVLPGTGFVLGTPEIGTSRRITHSLAAALRSAWTPQLTSELRVSSMGGPVNFWQEQTPALFERWKGYAPIMGNSYVLDPWNSGNTAPGSTRRNTPSTTARANFTYAAGAHTLTFGGSATQIDHHASTIGTDQIPTMTLGIATGDPINTGTTGIFNTTNFPNSTASQRTDAMSLYAILTGRVSSIARSLTIDEKTRNFSTNGTSDHARERFLGGFLQDSWKVRPGLTFAVTRPPRSRPRSTDRTAKGPHRIP